MPRTVRLHDAGVANQDREKPRSKSWASTAPTRANEFRAGRRGGAMLATVSKTQILLARLVIVLLIAFTAAGVSWYGLSEEVRHRVWEQLIERRGGPMTFRFILQPAMAAIAALRDGVNDAKSGRPPYFWALLTNPLEDSHRLYEGLISTARVILLGLCMDAIYQWIVLKTFYPGEAVIVAIGLAFFPYLLLRGPITRLARWI